MFTNILTIPNTERDGFFSHILINLVTSFSHLAYLGPLCALRNSRSHAMNLTEVILVFIKFIHLFRNSEMASPSKYCRNIIKFKNHSKLFPMKHINFVWTIRLHFIYSTMIDTYRCLHRNLRDYRLSHRL